MATNFRLTPLKVKCLEWPRNAFYIGRKCFLMKIKQMLGNKQMLGSLSLLCQTLSKIAVLNHIFSARGKIVSETQRIEEKLATKLKEAGFKSDGKCLGHC